MSEELIVKISADAEGVSKALDGVSKNTGDFEGKLSSAAKISGVAFAALSGQVVTALHAFAEAQAASNTLTQALQDQGIYSKNLKDSYDAQASSISALTGIEDEQITQAQAVAQSFLGQTPITEDLTRAIADLAVKQGVSLSSAAETLGKAISSGTGQLLRQGLQFSATDTEATRYQKTLDFVTLKAGGMAEAANTGLGAIKGLQVAFNKAQEDLGAKFAPAAEYVIKLLTEFLTPSKDASSTFLDFKAAAIVVGLAVTGFVTALGALGAVLPAIEAGMAALSIGLGPITLIVAAVAALGYAVYELATHWEEAGARIKAVIEGLHTVISGGFDGMKAILKGAMNGSLTEIKAGWQKIGDSGAKGAELAFKKIEKVEQKAEVEQDKARKKAADIEAKKKKEHNDILLALAKAQSEAMKMELANASASAIALKKNEIDILTKLEKEKDTGQLILLQEQLAKVRELEDKQKAEDQIRDQLFDQMTLTEKQNFTDKELATIKAGLLTQAEVSKNMHAEELSKEIEAHNQVLRDTEKYGETYAIINKNMHSSSLASTKSAFDELTPLVNSKLTALKVIGKAAAIANIITQTASSAMNVLAGFSVIPFIGVPLGIAGAAAVIAYGGERIAEVTAARDGGVVGGSGFGDKMPFMLEPGELVTPKRNFDEVVNSVAANRAGGGESSGSGGRVKVDVGFNGPQASRVLTVRQNEDKALGISRART